MNQGVTNGVFQTVFFRLVCSEGGQDPRGQAAPKSLKTVVFSGILCPSDGDSLPGKRNRHRPKGVFGKGVGNSKNASEMRQKCVLFYWEKRNVPKCVRNASKLRQKCAEHLWGGTPFSVTFLTGHGEICHPHGDPHGDLQNSPQHADPHGLGTFSRETLQEIHVDRRVVG